MYALHSPRKRDLLQSRMHVHDIGRAIDQHAIPAPFALGEGGDARAWSPRDHLAVDVCHAHAVGRLHAMRSEAARAPYFVQSARLRTSPASSCCFACSIWRACILSPSFWPSET